MPGKIILLLLLSLSSPAAFAAGEERLAWDFATPGQASGWTGEGIQTSGIRDGRLQILGGEQAQLLFPPRLSFQPEDNRYLKIRFKSSSPRYLQVLWETLDVPGEIARLSVPPSPDGNFRTRWIDLSQSRRWKGEIPRLALVFSGQPGWIEIDSIEIGPFDFGQYLSDQWSEFVMPRGLTLGTINYLVSPSLFNRPFIVWLNIIAGIAILGGGIAYLRARREEKARAVVRLGVALLIVWIVYDARETWTQFRTAEDIYRSYVAPPPEKKTFPPLGDFYRFVDFCRKYVPAEAVFKLLPEPFWPFDCRLKYFLLPSWVETETTAAYFSGRLPKYRIVYQSPRIVFDPVSGSLKSRDGKTVYAKKGRLIARYDPQSFIYLVEQE
jgi:hypothetical protein